MYDLFLVYIYPKLARYLFMSIPAVSNLSDQPLLNLMSNSFTLSRENDPLKKGLVEISRISFKFFDII